MARSGSRRHVLRRAAFAASVFAASAAIVSAADGQRQAEYRDRTIGDLPRPGYEPRTIMIGGVAIDPTVDASVTYSDNILATPTRTLPDEIVIVSSRIAITRKAPDLALSGDVHGSAIRYVVNQRENVDTFGANLQASVPVAANQTLSGQVAFDRTFEGRADPEAAIDRALPPALINVASAELRYAAQGVRFGTIASVAVTQVDYLRDVDADRDVRSYRASVRGSVNAGKRLSFFVQPFVNRRSFRIPVTRTGVFGDTTTTGILTGIAFDLADRLQGEIGVGILHANPDYSAASSFYGLAASGRVIWRPRVRTSVSLDLARGDVATIRAGALGRIDTRIALSINQEVRHNILVRAAGSWNQQHYRGGLDNDQSYLGGKIEGQYLFNRYLVGFLGADHVERSAALSSERFARWQTTAGLRLIL